MPHLIEFYKRAIAATRAGRRCVLGTVVYAQGSTPQKTGSVAFLEDGLPPSGTLGGGMVEAEGLRRMQNALDSGTPELFEYRLDDPYSRDAGPICGGVMKIFINPLAARSAGSLIAACRSHDDRRYGVVITVLAGTDSGTIRWHPSGNGHDPAISAEVIDGALRSERPRLFDLTDCPATFIEPIVGPPRLLVVGGGHVGQSVVEQGVRLGFEVTVLDDREEFAHSDLFPPNVTTVCGDIKRFVSALPQDASTYIVLVAKGHRPDAEALEGCIHGRAAYIGMIGSKRKTVSLRSHFLDEGLATPAEFDRIVAPIGFDIGAITVPEIGVAIAAQLVAARRLGRTGADSMHAAFQQIVHAQ
ncbi:MAG: XdhC family protein [Candidatus Hydrogenedentota bacterium]